MESCRSYAVRREVSLYIMSKKAYCDKGSRHLDSSMLQMTPIALCVSKKRSLISDFDRVGTGSASPEHARKCTTCL